MRDHEYCEEFNAWIPEVIAASLACDLETNLKALIGKKECARDSRAA